MPEMESTLPNEDGLHLYHLFASGSGILLFIDHVFVHDDHAPDYKASTHARVHVDVTVDVALQILACCTSEREASGRPLHEALAFHHRTIHGTRCRGLYAAPLALRTRTRASAACARAIAATTATTATTGVARNTTEAKTGDAVDKTGGCRKRANARYV